MDNLAHTLVGAALAQAGLKRRTGLGTATLMIAANLPDLDAFGLLVGENLAWRRGWTHGPPALLLLPLLLAAVMVAFDRWQMRRGTRPQDRPAVRFGAVLALAYIGIATHPLLDFLNTYGIRCLMPLSERWFYGDTLFIIDVWLWIVLGAGIWLSRRWESRGKPHAGRPALVALLLMAGYGAAMMAAGRAAEHLAARDLAARGIRPQRILASPVPVDPFRRRMLFDTGDRYGFGDFRWVPGPRFEPEPELVPTNMDHPAIAEAARRSKPVADFLYWSRFPFARITPVAEGTEVVLGDARFESRPGGGRLGARAVVPRQADGAGTLAER